MTIRKFGHSDDGRSIRCRIDGTRFPYVGPDGRREAIAACDAHSEAKAAEVDALFGTQQTNEVVEKGAPRNDLRTDREKRDARRRHESELNPVTPDTRTEAERYRDDLLARREEVRQATLSLLDRRIEVAQKKVDEEQAAATLLAAREAALNTDTAKKVRRDLNEAVWFAKYTADVPQETLDELLHQSAMLDRFGDAVTVGRNLSTIQTNLLAGLTTQADALKASADKIATRAAKLRGEPEPPKPASDIKTLLS